MAHPGGLSRSAPRPKAPPPAPRKPRSASRRLPSPRAVREAASDCDFGVALCLFPAFRRPPKA